MHEEDVVRPLLTRQEIRRLKKEIATTGSAQAAEQLLVDSTRKGHDKLALHRYALLRRLDPTRCAAFEGYCSAVAASLSPEDIQRAFEHMDRAWNTRALSFRQP